MQESDTDGQTLSEWTIVFDLDGTLVETAPDLLGALNHVLAAEGLAPVGLSAIRTMIGAGAKAMIREGLSANGADASDDRVERLWQPFLDHYSAHIADHSHPYPGVTDLLAQLRQAGARLAVCTNKTQALTDRLLETLELTPAFDAVIGADSVPSRKPDGDHILRTVQTAGGDPARAVMVGDSRTDERAALNAGLPFIFVTFGYERAPASDIAAHAVIDAYSDFLPALRSAVS